MATSTVQISLATLSFAPTLTDRELFVNLAKTLSPVFFHPATLEMIENGLLSQPASIAAALEIFILNPDVAGLVALFDMFAEEFPEGIPELMSELRSGLIATRMEALAQMVKADTGIVIEFV